MPGRASGHPNLNPIPMDRQLLVSGTPVVELTLVKCHQRLVVYPGANVNPNSAWKKADVFKINDDDDDTTTATATLVKVLYFDEATLACYQFRVIKHSDGVCQ